MKIKISYEAADALVVELLRDSIKTIKRVAKESPKLSEPERDAKLIAAMRLVLEYYNSTR